MLKRQQILLSEWLTDYLKSSAEEYDLSLSEVVRLTLCLYISELAAYYYPEYKCKFTKEFIVNAMRNFPKDGSAEENIHKAISEIYFEAHKAVEILLSKRKLNKNNNKK